MARKRSAAAGYVVAAVFLLVVSQACPDRKKDSESVSAGTGTTPEQAAVTPAAPGPVVVPETSALKPGFKDRRWGSGPSGMKYIGRSDGLTKLYEPNDADCIKLADEYICDIQYLYFRKRLFGVTFAESFVTRGAYRPSLLPALEAEWGAGTATGQRREWRSRDKKHGLTIATWTPSVDSLGGRWETVRIWSERIDAERLKTEADPNSADMRQLRREIEGFQRQQQRANEKYKM